MELHGGYRHKASMETGIPICEWLDFSANINPFGMPKRLKETIQREIEELIHYPDPDCMELTSALSEVEEVAKERIFCGNGGADVLYRYITALSPRKVCLPVPAFVEYEEILQNHWKNQYKTTMIRKGEEKKELETQGDMPELVLYSMEQWEKTEDGNVFWKPDHLALTEQFLQCLNSSYDLLILCSPNNPTRLVIPSDLLRKIVQKTKDANIELLLDLSFLDFVLDADKALEKELKQYSHVTILRSFTKMYGVPGVRLGYGVLGAKVTKEAMKQQGASWSVNHFAQKVGVVGLKETEFVKKTVDYVEKERCFMMNQLRQMGMSVIEGKANYLLFQRQGDKNLHKRLLKRGILIRSCQNYQGLTADYYRIGIKQREENNKLLEALKEELL